MAGKIPSGISSDAMLNQAQHIWSMLDEMATASPETYQKFIKKQLKDGQEVMKPPNPHMCVQTGSGQPDIMLFINVFEWNRIPNAKDDESPIPVMGGPLYSGKDEDGVHKLVCVAFNPDILQQFGLDSGLVEERRMLINLAMDYLEDQHTVKISRHYSVLDKKTLCKGPEKLAIQSLMKKSAQKDEEFQQQLTELERTFGPVAQGCKDSLLNKISNITLETTDQSETFADDHVNIEIEPEIRLPGAKRQQKKGLVQELSEVNGNKLPEPAYDLTTKEVNGQRVIVAKIHLPGVTSVQQCELDISEDDIQLTVSDQYQLQLSLPKRISQQSASAKFSKKSSSLTLSLPCIISDG
ncbi:hypothetical protein LSH36_202g04001 [Paralvinella palmiformis]|uniref:PIH1 domain-containing protein 2 n=1 Tax=Paralvinella palmiformis TaxID=53620 RepID=A0AAD9JPA2_9ANNE|nr:hypothetical protein LSH36_202g04001 [Paralvinella palmiformis]